MTETTEFEQSEDFKEHAEALDKLLGENPSNFLQYVVAQQTTGIEFVRALGGLRQSFADWLESFGDQDMQPGDLKFARSVQDYIETSRGANMLMTLAFLAIASAAIEAGELPSDYRARLNEFLRVTEPEAYERAQKNLAQAAEEPPTEHGVSLPN